MKRIMLSFFAGFTLLTLNPHRSIAGDVPVNVPVTPSAIRAAPRLSERVTHAMLEYLSACSLRDERRMALALAPDVAVEYALPEPGMYLRVDKDALVGHCDGNDPPSARAERVWNIRFFPTGDANTAFVSYDTRGSTASTPPINHLALVEMRGDRIATLRFFTAAPQSGATADPDLPSPATKKSMPVTKLESPRGQTSPRLDRHRSRRLPTLTTQ